MSYHIQEATCDMPAEWRDMTINVFMVGDATSAEFTFVITRDVLPQGTDLQGFADAQLKTCAKTLGGYQFVGKRPRTIQALPALEYDFTWRSEQQTMYQRQLVLALGGAKLLVCTATARDFLDDGRVDQIEALLSSMKLRGDADA